MIPATTVVVLFAAVLTALGDVQRPTQGHQLGDLPYGNDIILPLTVTQCDPVLIYYNNSLDDYLFLSDAFGYPFLDLYLPRGVGYFDWICNIPTGYSFSASFDFSQYYTVQPGSSNACLGDLNTTYPYAHYYTTNFQSYTQQSPSGDPSKSTSYQQPTVTFPTSSFSTITANPNLTVSSTTTTPAVSNKAIIAGGVVGGVTLVLLIATITFVFLRKRRNGHNDAALNSLTVESEPKDYSQLMAAQPGPAYIPDPVSPISVRHENEFTPDTLMAVAPTRVPFATLPDAGPPATYNSETVETISSFAHIAPPVLPKPENIVLSHRGSEQSTRNSRNSGADLALTSDAFARLTVSQQRAFMASLTASQRQALVVSLNASTDPTASEASLPAVSSPTQMPTAPPQSSMSEAPQEDLPDIANILTVISRARLSTRERHAMVASLNTLLVPDQATPADATRGNLPPLYAG